MAKATSAKKGMTINFGGVDKEIRKGSGKAAHVPEGDYLLKIVKHELRAKKDDETSKYYSWTIQIAAGKFKGKTIYFVTSLKPDALWNLRNLIHAITGKNVAGKAVNFTPESLYNKPFAGTLEDDEYEGKIKSIIADVRPKEELEAEDDEDDEDEDDEDEVEEEEDDDDEDLDDVDVEDI